MATVKGGVVPDRLEGPLNPVDPGRVLPLPMGSAQLAVRRNEACLADFKVDL